MKKRFNTEFYRVIDKYCVIKGITHKELAEKIDVNEATLSLYLTGQRKITLSAFMGICDVFGVKAEELYRTYLFSCMEQRAARYREEHETPRESEE